MPVDPEVQTVLDAIEAAGNPRLYVPGEEAAARTSYRAAGLAAPNDLGGLTVHNIKLPLTGRTLSARTYQLGEPGATVVFFHGGGWVVGDLDTHDRLCARIVRDTGAMVVSVDYRLAPEDPFPTPYEDCWDSFAYIEGRRGEFGGGKIAVAGDSAGGNLAAAVAHQARDEGVALDAALLLYPALDCEGQYLSAQQNASGYRLTADDMNTFIAAYADGADRTDPRMSPIYGQREGLCPTVIGAAGYDPLRDESTAYAEVLAKSGVDVTLRLYPTLIHGFFGMAAASKACDEAAGELTADLARYL
ncbi:MAG: alpha/beta hydrolase [Cumulibacter sp.]